MKEVSEIRLENARALAEQAGGTGAFAARVDREPTQMSRIVGKNPTKKIGDRMARHIEECFNKPRGWLDSEHRVQEERNGYDVPLPEPAVRDPNIVPTDLPDGQVPVLSWVQAGSWTEVCHLLLDPDDTIWLPKPPGASEETFALRVVGESMSPNYTPHTLIYVDPAVQPESGDDVVAILVDTDEATFKRFVQEPGGPKMLMAINEAWPQRFIEINGNCRIVGTVIASMILRKWR